MSDGFEAEKKTASAWFRTLRDEIVAAFEGLEDSQAGDAPAGRFEVSETTRTSDDGSDAGGGVMSVMRGGRVFEKVGVNISTVFGQLGDAANGGGIAPRLKMLWLPGVFPAWPKILGSGLLASRWWPTCRTRTRQRSI